jgi:alkylated DNA repair dioxygenase AlkB
MSDAQPQATDQELQGAPRLSLMPAKRYAAAAETGMADLFGEPEPPEGFRYTPNVLSLTEEQALVRRFEALPLQPFEFHGYLANRRIFTFGRSYIFAGQKPRPDAGIPDYLRPLMEMASAVSGAPTDAFEQVMVSEYPAGAGIGWHRDRPSYDDIVAISFLASCTLRLRRREGEEWERRSAFVEPRSIYLLRGPVRTSWQHSIAPMDVLRYSVTLRTFRKPIGATASS